jgi:CheY-like chemotaxis protein
MSASPVVYFIDDSATMREVIKIAFRRENINVITCHDPGSALTLMDQTAPDVVISDVIMPDKDGYEVCQYIRQHPMLAKTPVILMSGVVNRSVAEKAFAVKADELIRKPFQPQDLIARVRHLLHDKGAPKPVAPPPASVATMAALSSIFQSPAAVRPLARPSLAVVPRTAPEPQAEPTFLPAMMALPAVAIGESTGAAAAAPARARTVSAVPAPEEPLAEVCPPRALSGGEQPSAGDPGAPPAIPVAALAGEARPASQMLPTVAPPAADSGSSPAETQPLAPPPPAARKPRVPEPPGLQPAKTRLELLRLQSQIKKLEAELAAEREYVRALEEHIKTLQEAE